MPSPFVSVRNSVLYPISPLAGILNSIFVCPASAGSIFSISAFLFPNFSITFPTQSSGIFTTNLSIGSHLTPSISFMITFGLDTSNSKPSLLIVSINTDKCNSPLPDTSNASGVSVSFTLKLTFLSNSLNNLSLICLDVMNCPSLPANGPLFTLNVIETVGSSISTNGIFSGLLKSHIVSPIWIFGNPDISIISPAFASSISTFFSPICVYTFAILPCVILSSFSHMLTGIPTFIEPLSSLPTAILPT